MMPHVIYRCRLTKDLLVNESIHAEIPTVHGKVVVALDMHDAAGEMPWVRAQQSWLVHNNPYGIQLEETTATTQSGRSQPRC